MSSIGQFRAVQLFGPARTFTSSDMPFPKDLSNVLFRDGGREIVIANWMKIIINGS